LSCSIFTSEARFAYRLPPFRLARIDATFVWRTDAPNPEARRITESDLARRSPGGRGECRHGHGLERQRGRDRPVRVAGLLPGAGLRRQGRHLGPQLLPRRALRGRQRGEPAGVASPGQRGATPPGVKRRPHRRPALRRAALRVPGPAPPVGPARGHSRAWRLGRATPLRRARPREVARTAAPPQAQLFPVVVPCGAGALAIARGAPRPRNLR
jgi:hypothetical protein